MPPQIHQALVAHAVAMADNGAPRIAFGSITADEQPDLNKIRDHAPRCATGALYWSLRRKPKGP